MNEINIKISAEENASDELKKVDDAATKMSKGVQTQMADTEQAFDTAARSSGRLGAALDKAAGFGDNLSGGLQGVSDVTASVGDAMNFTERRAIDLAQAQQDVDQAAQDAAQAMQDLTQANRDAAQAELDTSQAAIDVEQALLNQRKAQEDYNKAVKENGRNSTEALQAQLDLKQAGQDLKQAHEDEAQALEDLAQSNLDASQAMEDQSQAAIDLKAAQFELEQQSSTLGKVSELSSTLSGVLGGLVGIIGAVTAIQWAWNASLLSNPIVLIVVAVLALVAAIVYLAVKTTFFQDTWDAIWGAIGDPVKAALDFIVSYFTKVYSTLATVLKGWWNFFTGTWKSAVDFALKYFRFIYDIPNKLSAAFSKIGDYVFLPFKHAFNMISWAWNNTIGRLHWSVPGWVPGIGGASVSAPRLPMLQRGGEVTQTGLALVHKGERVIPAGTRGLSGMSSGPMMVEAHFAPGIDREFIDWISEKLSFRVRTEGDGSAQTYWGAR